MVLECSHYNVSHVQHLSSQANVSWLNVTIFVLTIMQHSLMVHCVLNYTTLKDIKWKRNELHLRFLGTLERDAAPGFKDVAVLVFCWGIQPVKIRS